MPTSPTLFVTGATGNLGRRVIDILLETVPAEAIVAGVRDPAAAAAVAIRAKGVAVRVADYARPDTLTPALAGVDRLLLVSSSENGKRKTQHRNVIGAAKAAGVGLIAYTSILHADISPLFLAEEHRDAEAALADSGVPFVLLRNGWYTEVFTWRLPLAMKQGVLVGAAGDGRISAAARADYARAAATVLAGGDHAGRTYEMAGDASFTLAELVAVVAEASGAPLSYRDMTPDAFRSAALEAGVPEMLAKILSDTDAGVANGAPVRRQRCASAADRAPDHAVPGDNRRVRARPGLVRPRAEPRLAVQTGTLSMSRTLPSRAAASTRAGPSSSSPSGASVSAWRAST